MPEVEQDGEQVISLVLVSAPRVAVERDLGTGENVPGIPRREGTAVARPWSRSVVHMPVALMNSPALMAAACPTTVTKSRWPRALTRNTQKPVSALW